MAAGDGGKPVKNQYKFSRLSGERIQPSFGNTDIDPLTMDPQHKKIIATIGEISYLTRLKIELATFLSTEFVPAKITRKRRWRKRFEKEISDLDKKVSLKNEELSSTLLHISSSDEDLSIFRFNNKDTDSIYAAIL